MTFWRWSQTAASNATADTTINAREGQAPSTVNDAMRAMMAAAAKFRDDRSGNLVTGGSSTAYTLTTNQTLTSLTDGFAVTARMNATNGAAPTLNVDSLGAKAIAGVYGTAIPIGALRSGGVYTFVYDSTDDKWIVHGIGPASHLTPTDGNIIVGDGSGWVTESGATARTSLGLGTGDSPQFTAVNVGNASDTTIARAAAGRISVEGVNVVTISSTDTLTNKTINLSSNTLVATSAQLAAAVTDGTGSGALVFATSPTLVTPALGTPSSGTLTNCTGLPFTSLSGTLTSAQLRAYLSDESGTGVALFQNGALGTPASGTLTSCTGLPIDGGTTGTLPVARGGTGVTASTGSGNVVLSTSPTLTTPNIGTPSAGTLTNCTGLPIANTTGTLAVNRGGTGVTTSTGTGNVVLSVSPALTGSPTAPTQSAATENTTIATTAFVWGTLGAPTGTKMVFNQTAAPTGWTKDTTHNNKALRVVSGTVSSGGSQAFSTASITIGTANLPPHTHTFAGDTDQKGDHAHAVSANRISRDLSSGSSDLLSGLRDGDTGNEDATSSTTGIHFHSISGNTGNGPGSSTPISLDLQYVDVIIATRN